MPNVSHHNSPPKPAPKIAEKKLFEYDDNRVVNEEFEKVIINPLLSGKAYHVKILEFKSLDSSSFSNRFDDFKLDKNMINGYINEYNIEYKPFVICFEFNYKEHFIENAKKLFENISSTRYCNNNVRSINDIRHLDIPCAIFGDFQLEYIEKEGWYGIKNMYLDTFQSVRSEFASILANKLNKLFSYLYFSFCDNNGEHVVGVYSDFRDYSLAFYNTRISRKVSRILTNSANFTYPMYQVEPLSPFALSYKLRTFFLIRQGQGENNYAFIIYLSDDEIDKIKTLKAWANAQKYSSLI